MKKNVVKKSLKLQLNRETLHALEETQLPGIAGGATIGGCPTQIPCTTYTKYC